MGRRMWPYEAVVPYSVRATFKQAGEWGYAANLCGLKVPVFLARAADDYARRLEQRIARQERKERKP